MNNVQVKDGKLVVQNFVTENDEVVSYFEEMKPQDIERRFATSLNVGVIALKTIGTTEKVDYIQKEFDKLNSQFSEVLSGTKEEISTNIDSVFGERGTFQELLEKHFGENGLIVKDLFDPMKDGSPINQLKRIILDELDTMQKNLGTKEAEEKIIQRTALKGPKFEDLVEVLLGEIVKPNIGDELSRTGNDVGEITDSKKGDFIIDVKGKSEYRIVLETKDRTTISLPEIQEELDEALKNRSAKFAIFVSKWVEALPNSVGCFNCYRDDKIVCGLGSKGDQVLHKEILHTAYFWARTNLLKKSKKVTEVNFSLIDNKLEELKNQFDSFNDIKRQCSNIEKASQKIKDSCDEIKERVSETLKEIAAELEKNPDQE